ncbi:MAG: ABC transporter ATP-binding protein, partial [Rhodospirillales bacterium]|nr:ABC transporter ATP-binding protein [Rhodospirillales bacterium]
AMATRKTIFFITHAVDEAAFLADRCLVFSRRPGRLKAVVKVDIPREERLWKDLVSDPRFTSARDEILRLVREEVTVDDE